MADAGTEKLEELLNKQKNDVNLLRAFLGVAMKQKLQAEWSRDLDLERQIKELIYDVEDLHDSFSIEKLNTKGRGRLDKVRSTMAREIEIEIESMNNSLIPMLRMIGSYKDLQLVQKENEVTSVQQDKEVLPIRQNNIVGFEDDAKALINYLMEDTKELDVMSITGMPGIGKTTLAWMIYQNEMIKQKFPTRIWVDIPLDFRNKDFYVIILDECIRQGMIDSQELMFWFDIPQESCSKDSCLDMLHEFTKSGRIHHDQLSHAVRACLEKNRLLLVLDGVRTANTFESIRCFLPKTGKVLITSCLTRINHLTRKSHVLRFLDEDESWKLLQFEVFGKLNSCPEMLSSTGKSIAKSCDGSPLAIVGIASSLVVAPSTIEAMYLNEQRWKKVSSSENVLAYLTDYDQRRVFTSVELTYITLTPCLQDCFLYLGVFPDGQEISVPTLTRLWIAERLVQRSERLTFEESAEQSLEDLIDRNLVMVGKMYPNGQIKTCRLHTLIYGFCKVKAAEKDFYHDIRLFQGRGGGRALDCPISLTPNHRRLCIYSHLSEFFSNGQNGEYIRSILCHNKEDQTLHTKYSSSFHKYFKLLRIYDCKYARFNKFPKLSNLIHLKYISLSCDDLRAIPDTISSLIYLETLEVNTQSPSLELKTNIWMMFQLRHLVTKAAIVLAIRGGGGEAGDNLQTLTRLAPECCTEDVLTRVPNLKRLGIRGQLAALSSAESLRNMRCLQHLKLINESVSATDQLHHLFVSPGCFPPNLKSLTLSATNLEWGWMSALGKIHTLEMLKLKNIAFTRASWSNSADADDFRGIGFLLIGTTNLVSWEASADCFPNLKYLVLKNCEKLEKLPLTLAKSLDTLDLESVPQSGVEPSEIEEQEQQKHRLHVFELSIC